MYQTLIISSVVALIALLVLSFLYKFAPYRLIENKKPRLDFLPKYKTSIRCEHSLENLEKMLAEYGFKKSGVKDGITYFYRGSLLGDFSIKLIKVKLGIQVLDKQKMEISLAAAWFIAFDTGDFWTFMKELGSKLENSSN